MRQRSPDGPRCTSHRPLCVSFFLSPEISALYPAYNARHVRASQSKYRRKAGLCLQPSCTPSLPQRRTA
ncbi:hypothetical protein MHYP_G00256590 [Metynnis hypsauchen]